MPNSIIPLPFPKGGVDRRFNLTESPALTTSSASNVRLTETIAGRERGGRRPGFSRVYPNQLAHNGGRGINMMATVRFIQHHHNKSRLVVAAGGSLYMESDTGALNAVASTTISRWNDVQAVDYAGKLYIANTGRALQGDWISRQIGTNAYDLGFGNPFLDFSSTYTGSSYYAAGDISANPEALSRVAISEAPLIFDPIALTVEEMVATEGTAPPGCQIITTYRGRLVLAGDPVDPQQWYMSRVENPLDWDYSQEDETAAVSGTTSLAGKIGAPITAFAPHSDLCMVIACRTSLWILRGDPISGTMDNISHEIGIVDKNAWCNTADGWMVFLSHDGIYAIPAECATRRPESLSREKLPEELLGVDPNLYTVNLIYDVKARGVHIFVSPIDSYFPAHNWFLDWETKSFWPVELYTDYHVFDTCFRRDIATNKSTAWCGCRDGYIRYFDETAEVDDVDYQFPSHVMLGPFKAGDSVMAGVLVSLRAKLATGSQPVTWEVMTGNSAQEALEASASYSGAWDLSNMQYKQYPRVRGNEIYVKVSSSAPWALDEIVAEFKAAGMQRR